VKVTAVVPKCEPTPEFPTVVSLREFHHVDRLARAVGVAMATEIAVVEGTIDDAPAGYVLAFELPTYVDVPNGMRVIAIASGRSYIMKQVEAQRLAGAVELHRYFQWTAHPERERGEGLVGRKDLAERLHARLVSGPYTSANYSWLASDTVKDLPSLIAAYLVALSQVSPHA
jgi:hypothetical protein